MTREIIEKYELDGNNVKIIYTDGSKTEGWSVEAAIGEEGGHICNHGQKVLGIHSGDVRCSEGYTEK